MPWAIVSTTLLWRANMVWRASLNFFKTSESFSETVSKLRISWKVVVYQLSTRCIEGTWMMASGRWWISVRMLARRTGSSFLRKVKDCRSVASLPKSRSFSKDRGDGLKAEYRFSAETSEDDTFMDDIVTRSRGKSLTKFNQLQSIGEWMEWKVVFESVMKRVTCYILDGWVTIHQVVLGDGVWQSKRK